MKIPSILYNESEPHELVRFLQYRQKISEVTPFSDYFITRRIPGRPQKDTRPEHLHTLGGIGYEEYDVIPDELDLFIEEDDYRLLFFEECVIAQKEDIYSTGLASRNDSFHRLEGMCADYLTEEMIFHPILGNPFYTHSFINLDFLIEKADQAGFAIPNELRKQSAPKTPIEHNAVEGIIKMELNFDHNEQFILLKLIPIIIERLTNDPVGKELMSNEEVNTKITEVLHNSIKLALQTHTVTLNEVGHIWQIITPPNRRKIILQKELKKARIKFWQGNEPIALLLSNDRMEKLKTGGINRAGAKALNALLTPEVKKVTGRLDESELEEYRNLIMAIDLDWTEQETL